MKEQALRLSTVWRLLRRRWRLLLALAALGAVAGLATSLVVPPTYESGSTVLLEGYRSEEEVITEAQIAMSSVVVDRAVTELGWDVDLADVRDAVTAEVTAGNVIRITAAAPGADEARLLAAKVTDEYIAFSTEIATESANASREVLQRRQATLQQRIEDSDRRIRELQTSDELGTQDTTGVEARAELQQERDRRENAYDELAIIDQGIAEAETERSVALESVRLIEAAVAPDGAEPPTLLHLVAGGGVIFALLGALAVVAVHHGDRRLRREADIAAAVGAPVLGVVAAGTGTTMTGRNGRPVEGWKARVGGLLREDAPSMTRDEDPALEQLRYGRVLDQLLAGSPTARVLVVMIEGDVLAAGAAASLAATAAAAGRRASIVPDASTLSATVRAAVAGEPTGRGSVTVVTDPPPYASRSPHEGLVFPLAVVSASRPMVPPQPDVSATLLVVTSGTTTGAVLLGVAQACQDADHPVAGVLLVRTGADGDESEPPEWASAATNGRTPAPASNGHHPGGDHRHG